MAAPVGAGKSTKKTAKKVQAAALSQSAVKASRGKSPTLPAPEKQVKNTKIPLWKPGQSGNPKGRPKKGESLTDALREVLGEDGKVKIAQKLISLATSKKPNIAALKYIYDRIDGMPIQSLTADITADLPIIKIPCKAEEPSQESKA
jgi:hypothetical protein